MGDDRTDWNERYRDDEFAMPDRAAGVLRENLEWLPRGRALDVATGTGRNARFLADAGYEVDAVDVSDVALRTARAEATARGLRVNWVQADLETYRFPVETYDVIVVTFFHTFDRLPDIKDALAPGGVLLAEHHLRSVPPADRGPSSERYRTRSNDLLRAVLDLTILRYEERTTVDDGRRSAIATLVARNSCGGAQTYPPERPPADG